MDRKSHVVGNFFGNFEFYLIWVFLYIINGKANLAGFL